MTSHKHIIEDKNLNYNLNDIISDIIEFRKEREWEQFHKPKELALAIGIEVSELQEHFLWRERETIDSIISDDLRFKQIKEELADIAIYLLYMCYDFNIDLVQAIVSKLKMNRKKYPKDKFKGRF